MDNGYIALNIEVKNKKPLELVDFTNSLIALSKQYNSFVKNNGYTIQQRQSKLYVKKITTGSIILDLIEFTSASVIPLVDNTNTIIAFAKHIKSVFTYLIKNEGEKPEINAQDCRDFSQIVSPIANDGGSQMNINVNNYGSITNYLTMGSTEGSALQNNAKKMAERLTSQSTEGTMERVVMTLYQTRKGSTLGNKAIIDAVVKDKPINLLFGDNSIQHAIFNSNENPYKLGYQVDIKVETCNGKIVAYTVTHIHETFPLDLE